MARDTRSSEAVRDPGARSSAFGWRLLWFIPGAVITYAVIMVIAINKPAALRGARVGGEWFPVYENDTELNLATVGMVAGVVGLLMLARSRLQIAWAFIIGQCFALLVAVIVLLGR
jgi:hypothetical protein